MSGTVEIPAEVLAGVAAHARRALPEECCGLLIGATERAPEDAPPAATVYRVCRAVPVRNVAASATRYVVDPVDHFAAIRAARTLGLRVVGAYHSHPGSPAIPSRRDLAESHFSDFVHLIVSVRSREDGCDLRAYRLAGGRAIALRLEEPVAGR